jgi:hypothetical protein
MFRVAGIATGKKLAAAAMGKFATKFATEGMEQLVEFQLNILVLLVLEVGVEPT